MTPGISEGLKGSCARDRQRERPGGPGTVSSFLKPKSGGRKWAPGWDRSEGGRELRKDRQRRGGSGGDPKWGGEKIREGGRKKGGGLGGQCADTFGAGAQPFPAALRVPGSGVSVSLPSFSDPSGLLNPASCGNLPVPSVASWPDKEEGKALGRRSSWKLLPVFSEVAAQTESHPPLPSPSPLMGSLWGGGLLSGGSPWCQCCEDWTEGRGLKDKIGRTTCINPVTPATRPGASHLTSWASYLYNRAIGSW